MREDLYMVMVVLCFARKRDLFRMMIDGFPLLFPWHGV